ncbi:phospholipase D-like domain-containing protein [Halorubrum amylolyticum]|uniref:phospholipase D-like domain-containing protein n=1 Tax=Halorubrum amylolyticum TaxID=2508724 RepID=UPI0013E8C62A|nr:phospholipase D-like domain-containing protein [Halorubrum amylolyticum]
MEEFYSETEEYRVRHAPAFWILDRFDSDKAEIFLNQFGEDLDANFADYLLVELSNILTPLYRLYIENQKPKSCTEHIELIHNVQKKKQQFSGHIANEHPRQFRSLVHIDPDSEATQRACNHFLENYNADEDYNKQDINSIPGILGLMELNYQKYENITRTWLQYIEDLIVDDHTTIVNNRVILAGELLEASIQHRKYSLPQSVATSIESRLVDYCANFNQTVEESDFDDLTSEDYYTKEERSYGAVMTPSYVVNSLTAIGHGYSVSGFEREWENRLSEKEQERTRSKFVSTLPAMEMWGRKREIQQKAESMINSSEEELRISSLRIDMLHEDLIDIVESDTDVEVKILTNTGSSRGERRKMANAVMNELARRTKGNVHEHQLVHARMVIADDRELLVSSADLTRDQLADEFNSGIYTKDPDAVEQAIEAFDEMWSSGDKLNPRNS